jgi:4-carboxymuconolactone decarboxylase
MPDAPRIPPLEPPYDPDTEAMLRKWMPPGAAVEPLALFRTLAVHDDLAARMRPLGAGILGHGRIEPCEREIVIARACARAGAEYEWGVHAVAFARPLGFGDALVAATVHGRADDPAFSERDSLLIRLVDELHETATISDALWEDLAAGWAPDQLLELVIAAGWYRLLAGVINACRVPLESWAERFPAPAAAA